MEALRAVADADLGPGRGALVLPDEQLHRGAVDGGGDEGFPAKRLDHQHPRLNLAPEAKVLPRAIELARGLAGKDRATLAAVKRGLFESPLATLRAPLPEWLAGQ